MIENCYVLFENLDCFVVYTNIFFYKSLLEGNNRKFKYIKIFLSKIIVEEKGLKEKVIIIFGRKGTRGKSLTLNL
uniref:Uncharacterized protein n=1 Tax=Meloidogyne enterolobii TaxID=390850 RepID=A0A6V7UT55_MELEN|nr:unnamed protein product [Meloidogyne enterolobii]